MLGMVLLAFHDIRVTFILTTIQKYPEATTWYKPFMMVMLKVALQKNADLTSVRKVNFSEGCDIKVSSLLIPFYILDVIKFSLENHMT